MKKILLSLVALIAAISINAKEVITTGNTGTYGEWVWTGLGWYSQGNPVSDKEAGTVDDSNVIYGDKSEFDYVVYVYSSTCAANAIIQYHCTGVYGQWGPNYFESSAELPVSAKTSYVAIKLDPDHKNKFASVNFQPKEAGTITFEEVSFMTAAEYDEFVASFKVTEWETEGYEVVLKKIDEEGKTKAKISASEFNGYTDDAKVEFTFSTTAPSGFMGWGAASVSSIGGDVVALPHGKFGIKGETTTIVSYLGDLKEALNAKSAEGTYGLYWNIWNFGATDGVNEIVSCKIYEMVGATGEKFVAQKDEPKLYVVGDVSDNDWDFTKGVELVYNPETGNNEGVIEVVESWEGNGYFALTQILGTAEEKEANDWTNFNKNRYAVSKDWGELDKPGTIAQIGDASFCLPAGTYLITVNLTDYVVLIQDGATGINVVATSVAKTGKRLENGSVVIYKNGKKYNAAGAVVK